mgnify:FL=1
MDKPGEHVSCLKWVGVIFSVCLIYSFIRYITLGPEDVSQLPLYVMNKALSWAGLATIGLSRLLGHAAARKQAGLIGALMIGLHVVMSMLVLKPEYLRKFFDSMNGMKLTGAGEASMLAGVLGLGFLAWLLWATAAQANGSSDSNGNGSLLPWVGRAVLICGALHVALMGWDIWFAPEKWANYGHLPPITLLSFVTAVVFLTLRRRKA